MHHPLSELPVRSRPSSIIIILHSTGGAHEEPGTAKALPILGMCAATAELDSNSPAPWAKVLTQGSVTTSSKDRKQLEIQRIKSTSTVKIWEKKT